MRIYPGFEYWADPNGRELRPNEHSPSISESFRIPISLFHFLILLFHQHSKIGKVMRHITILEVGKVPRGAEFHLDQLEAQHRHPVLLQRGKQCLGNAGSDTA